MILFEIVVMLGGKGFNYMKHNYWEKTNNKLTTNYYKQDF